MALPGVLKDRLRLPVVGAPMFLISNPELVIAQCTAGITGAFPSLNARPVTQLDEWLHRITEELAATPDAAPYAVNLIVHKSNPRVDEDLALCVKWKVPVVITSLGAREDVNRAVQEYGGITLHDVIHDRFARKAIEKGATGLIAVAAGAGGHAGTLSPFALVQEIREWFAGPLALAGAIATGAAVLAAQAMGADLAYVGSAFIATHEANAAEDYKRMVVECESADIVYTDVFSGVHGNYLRPSLVRAGFDPEHLPEKRTMDFTGLEKTGPQVWKDIVSAGQGIGAIRGIVSARELVERLGREYREALARLAEKARGWN